MQLLAGVKLRLDERNEKSTELPNKSENRARAQKALDRGGWIDYNQPSYSIAWAGAACDSPRPPPGPDR
jgi:hypothetical protein